MRLPPVSSTHAIQPTISPMNSFSLTIVPLAPTVGPSALGVPPWYRSALTPGASAGLPMTATSPAPGVHARNPPAAPHGYTSPMSADPIRIVEATTPDEIDTVSVLFGEYASSLGWDLSAGWIADEIAALPGPYAPPRGSLLLAYVGGEPAGALGVQPVSEAARIEGVGAETAGELKRMFVRPRFRGAGVGRALAKRAEDEGLRLGYDALVLTTNAEMFPLAQGLYESLGYVEMEPYRDDMPYPDIRWMRLAL